MTIHSRGSAPWRAAHWGPGCDRRQIAAAYWMVGVAKIQCDRRAIGAFRALGRILQRHGYPVRSEVTGAYNCRAITGGTVPSAHAQGIAIDVNWDCLGGDTEVITWDGPKPIRELAGKVVRILTRDPINGGAARWVDAPFRAHGVREVFDITLSRRGVKKVVRATGNHHWWHVHGFAQARKHWRRVEVMTSQLEPGMRILGGLPPGTRGTLPAAMGVAAGIVYGDGNRESNRGSMVDLYGASMTTLRFFPEPNVHAIRSAGGVDGLRVYGLPGYLKEAPPLDESASYLLGWLAGYFSADGSVSESGVPILVSARKSDIDLFRLVALRVGIGCSPARVEHREGYGGGTGEKWRTTLYPSTVPESFFVRPDHAARFTASARRPSDHLWTVESIVPAGREEVYCATVAGTHTFVLEDFLLTGNTNPYRRDRLVTDMPRAMVEDVEAIKTRAGVPAFRWGGDWDGRPETPHSNYDAMHFEVIATPEELAVGFLCGTVIASDRRTWYLLGRGERGVAVQQLQTALGITADGIFGPATELAVNQYQASRGLPVDGLVGLGTWTALWTSQPPIDEANPNPHKGQARVTR